MHLFLLLNKVPSQGIALSRQMMGNHIDGPWGHKFLRYLEIGSNLCHVFYVEMDTSYARIQR